MIENAISELSVVHVFASAALVGLVVVCWRWRNVLPTTSPYWFRVAAPCLLVTAGLCGMVIVPPSFLAPMQVITGFYAALAALLAVVTCYLTASRSAKLVLWSSTAALVLSVLFTDFIIAGATTHNDLLTKVPGPGYLLYLAFSAACVAAQAYGLRALLRATKNPRERNRLRYGTIALGANHVAAVICIAAMTSNTPFTSAAEITPFSALFGLVVFAHSMLYRSLPLLALPSSPDTVLHAAHKDAIAEAMSLALVMSYDDAIRVMVDGLSSDGLMPPATAETATMISSNGAHCPDELSALAWNKELEQLIAELIEMDPATHSRSFSVLFDAGEATHVDRLMYLRPARNEK